MADNTTAQSSCSSGWTDIDTEWEIVLSTLYSMFGELPSAPAGALSSGGPTTVDDSTSIALPNEELHGDLPSEAETGALQEGSTLDNTVETFGRGAPSGGKAEALHEGICLDVKHELSVGVQSGVDGEVTHNRSQSGMSGYTNQVQTKGASEEGRDGDPTSGVIGEVLQDVVLAVNGNTAEVHEKGSQSGVLSLVKKEWQGSVPPGVKKEGDVQVNTQLLQRKVPIEMTGLVMQDEVQPIVRREASHTASRFEETECHIHPATKMEALNGTNPIGMAECPGVIPSPVGMNAIHNGVQRGVRPVALYGGVPSQYSARIMQGGIQSGAKMGALRSEVPSRIRWMHGGGPSGFLVHQQPSTSMPGATMYRMPSNKNPFIPHGYMNQEQGAYFQNQNVYVPVVDNGGVSSLGPYNDKQRVIQIFVNPHSTPHPPQAVTPKQRRNSVQKNRPYIRRPPNAFMIFMRENREKITNTLKPKHSVEANTILGQMWREMSPSEQEIYYQKAAEERRIHAEKHPDWSSKDNYGLKRKRQRRKNCPI
ncbi:uncharacterized protein ACB058_003623 [Synchiropus picturatus]